MSDATRMVVSAWLAREGEREERFLAQVPSRSRGLAPLATDTLTVLVALARKALELGDLGIPSEWQKLAISEGYDQLDSHQQEWLDTALAEFREHVDEFTRARG